MSSEASKEQEKFDRWLIENGLSEKSEGAFTKRSDEAWKKCASEYLEVKKELNVLEARKEALTRQLIFLSGHVNSVGCGLSVCQVKRKGNIDYSSIDILKEIDLEKYRKEESVSWRITLC